MGCRRAKPRVGLLAVAGANVTRARDINRVRLRREEQGMLLKELADKVERSAALISMCEGGFVPRRATQVKLAAALSTTPEALWPEEYQ